MKPKPFEIIVEFIPQCTKTGITYETYQKGLLIRCKDCKWNSSDKNWVDCMISEMYGRNATDNYCSRAERKDNGKNTNAYNAV